MLLADSSSYNTLVEGVLIILTTGLVANLLCRQFSLPALMGYIATGITIGPSAMGLIRTGTTEIEHVAEVGVFLLLFSIGLELSIQEMKRSARFLLIGGPVQMLLVAIPVALTLKVFQWSWASAWLAGAALAFSSTVLVFKSLGELGGVGTRLGRATIAMLLFQDAALIPLLLCLPLLIPMGAQEGLWLQALQWIYMGLVTIGFLAGTLLVRYLMTNVAIPRIMKHRSPEVVVLLALVILGSVTLIAARIGLPAAVGAFAAGVILGETRWAEQIDTLILPFRELFSAVFFVSLGLLIDPAAVLANPIQVLLYILILTAIKWIAAGLAFWVNGIELKQAIGPALGLSHVGEFAFVLLMVASTSGVIQTEQRQTIFAVAGGTLLIAPLLIRNGFRRIRVEPQEGSKLAPHSTNFSDSLMQATVIGMGPIGRATASQLDTLGYQLACLDLNPLNLQSFAQMGLAKIVVGDAQSTDCLESAGVDRADLIIICIPQDEISIQVTNLCRKMNRQARIIVRCRYLHTTSRLRQAGATHVVSEEANAAEQLVRLISN